MTGLCVPAVSSITVFAVEVDKSSLASGSRERLLGPTEVPISRSELAAAVHRRVADRRCGSAEVNTPDAGN